MQPPPCPALALSPRLNVGWQCPWDGQAVPFPAKASSLLRGKSPPLMGGSASLCLVKTQRSKRHPQNDICSRGTRTTADN